MIEFVDKDFKEATIQQQQKKLKKKRQCKRNKRYKINHIEVSQMKNTLSNLKKNIY